MIPDIFASFDPITACFTNQPSIGPIIGGIGLPILITIYVIWPSSRWQSTLIHPKNLILSQLITTSSTTLKGLSARIISLFFLFLLSNLLGLVPYTFSSTRHLILTLTVGLPLWLSIVISSISYNYISSLAHLLPEGSPGWLSPFLVLIETTRIILRPITLSFRLAANMTAGHILLTLATVIFSSASLIMSPVILFTSFFLLFETAICFIQAYIFVLLLTLYRNDHS